MVLYFQWYREVRTHGGSAPVLLCGCKADLRHEKETLTMLSKLRTHPVTSEEVRVNDGEHLSFYKVILLVS